MELFIQLSTIMIGNQAIDSIIEIVIPFICKLYRQFRYGKKVKQNRHQYMEDFKLITWDTMGLFQEYLEMVIQYG